MAHRRHRSNYKPGQYPLPNEIEEGEIAINFPDKALYSKDRDNNIIRFTNDSDTGIYAGVTYTLRLGRSVVTCDTAWNPVDPLITLELFEIDPEGIATQVTSVPTGMIMTIDGGIFEGDDGELVEDEVIPDNIDVTGVKSAVTITIVRLESVNPEGVILQNDIGYVKNGTDGGPGTDGERGSVRLQFDVQHSSYSESMSGTYDKPIEYYRKTGDTSWIYRTSATDTWYELIDNQLPDEGADRQIKGDEVLFNCYVTTTADPVTGIYAICTENATYLSTSRWDWDVHLLVHGNAVIDGTLTAEKLKSGYLDISNIGVDGGNYCARVRDTGASATLNSVLYLGAFNGNSCHALEAWNGTAAKPTLQIRNAVSAKAPTWYSGNDLTTNNIIFWNDGDADFVGDVTGNSFTSFTGTHVYMTTEDVEVGDIVFTSNAKGVSVNNVDVDVLPTTKAKDKRVIGVCAKLEGLEPYIKRSRFFSEFGIKKVVKRFKKEDKLIEVVSDETTRKFKSHRLNRIKHLRDGGSTVIYLNGLGDGMMNVCSEGGNIENGDYICSSTVKGKAMKQDDDLLHNHTVAKALEDVDWSKEPKNTKMIGCTYHCG